jgi:acetyl-CoA synthase
MTKNLKESLKDAFDKRAEEEGVPDLLDKIADESVAEDSEKLLEFLTSKGHPALEMDPMF